jgi:hypothetical protein
VILDHYKKFRRVTITVEAPLQGGLFKEISMTTVMRDVLTAYKERLEHELVRPYDECASVFKNTTGLFKIPAGGGKTEALVSIKYRDWRDSWRCKAVSFIFGHLEMIRYMWRRRRAAK